MALTRFVVFAIACVALTGCQEKETVVDVETPSGDIEVTKDKDSGDIEVKVDRDPATEAASTTETAPE